MEKLNCKSLMIGDWVSYGETFIKVGNVYEDCINFQHDIPFVQEEFLIEQTEIEPIPLTPEILEKNGFHEEWDDDITLMVCDTIIVEIGNNYKLYKDGKMYLRRVLAPLYYVHELQHALRLCGIEKEIEL